MLLSTRPRRRLFIVYDTRYPIYKSSLSDTFRHCDKQYIGETGRGLRTRISEHRREYVSGHVLSNSIVVHVDKSGHLPTWEQIETFSLKRLKICIDRVCQRYFDFWFYSRGHHHILNMSSSIQWSDNVSTSSYQLVFLRFLCTLVLLLNH